MHGPLDDDERRELRQKARGALLGALRALDGEALRPALLERALADGGFTPRELAAPPPEAAAGGYERLVDHQLSWALTGLRRDGLVENPRRSVWRLSGAALETARPAVGAPVAIDRLAELRAMPYRKYLRTPEWRRTRAAALLRAGQCCSLDVTHTTDLDVHHRTYERLGCELATDLVVLCRPCHAIHHEHNGRPRRTPKRSVQGASAQPALTVEPQRRRKRSLLRRLLAS
jgi:hypothetical protein